MPDLEPAVLLYEGYESIRLVDYEGLSQEEASKQMGVSRPTLTRIHDKAIKSIAQAFVEGKAILIEGGDYHSDNYWYRCEDCKKLNGSATESRHSNVSLIVSASGKNRSPSSNPFCTSI